LRIPAKETAPTFPWGIVQIIIAIFWCNYVYSFLIRHAFRGCRLIIKFGSKKLLGHFYEYLVPNLSFGSKKLLGQKNYWLYISFGTKTTVHEQISEWAVKLHLLYM
jgi:hypothetical protein